MADPEVTKFLSRYSEDQALRTAVAKVKPGDMNAIIRLAASHGFRVTAAALKEGVPRAFFKGNGNRPDHGWPEPP